MYVGMYVGIIIHMSKSDAPGNHITAHHLRYMCRNAVGYSQGQLVDITMDGFCSDTLLHYISHRCSKLQRLRVAFSYEVSGKVLIKALKEFPMLNELYLFSLFSTSSGVHLNYDFDIEAIGCACPTLRSFTFTYRVDQNSMDPYDKDTFDVAKNMPGLRHLRLLGNGMTEEGLEDILDGCPHLESLDIRLCFNAEDLSEDIKERCRRQLIQVWFPEDSCSDHEFYDRLDELVTFVEELRESEFYSPGYGWYPQY